MAQHAGAPRTRWPQARLREAAQDRRHRGVFREWMTSYFAVWRSGPMCRRAADPLAAGPLAGSGAGPPAPSGFPGMDDIVLRGMAKWPNVPAVYGWLSLDRRGHWLLKGERVVKPGIAAFFGRNYSRDDQGRWFLQNGPQRVYVTLDYTPHVYRVTSPPDAPLALAAHRRASV